MKGIQLMLHFDTDKLIQYCYTKLLISIAYTYVLHNLDYFKRKKLNKLTYFLKVLFNFNSLDSGDYY